jgi:hypothetical protein
MVDTVFGIEGYAANGAFRRTYGNYFLTAGGANVNGAGVGDECFADMAKRGKEDIQHCPEKHRSEPRIFIYREFFRSHHGNPPDEFFRIISEKKSVKELKRSFLYWQKRPRLGHASATGHVEFYPELCASAYICGAQFPFHILFDDIFRHV